MNIDEKQIAWIARVTTNNRGAKWCRIINPYNRNTHGWVNGSFFKHIMQGIVVKVDEDKKEVTVQDNEKVMIIPFDECELVVENQI